jgi:signal transduction histidine kinase
MTRTSYLLFAIVILLLVACLFLYKRSWQKSIDYNERMAVVYTVLNNLERLENLTQSSNAAHALHRFPGTLRDEIDSIVGHLDRIVLYEDQRLRIDTIRTLVERVGQSNNNFTIDDRDHLPSTPEVRQLGATITRAESYAKVRLTEQIARLSEERDAMNSWVNGMLVLSFLLFAIGMFSIVSERSAKTKLKALHDSILNNASIGICLYECINPKNQSALKLLYSNDAARKLDTGSRHQLFIEDVCRKKNTVCEKIHLVLQTGKTERFEVNYNVDHSNVSYLISLSKVSATEVAMYFLDITQIKLYEAELNSKVLQLEKVNADLEQFAQATSHDLQEPFRKISVVADMIRENVFPTRNEKYLETIIRAAHRGQDLVQQVLNYSRLNFDEKAYEIIALQNVISHITEDLEISITEKKAQVRFENMPVIRGNHTQIVQLFTNLISNSLKFASGDRAPVITITSKTIPADDVKNIGSLNPLFDYHMISVSDNGIGFHNDHKEKIFNAFHRLENRSYAGFGLGLSLCKKIALNHNGDINATSIPGDGSQFIVYLPKSD